MITFKIDRKQYPIPTTWQDVSYRNYVALLKSVTLTDHISIFTRIPKETLEAAELKNLEKITLALSFLSIAPTFERTRLVGPYALPEDVTIQSTGQFEDLRGLLLKMPKDPMEDPEKIADSYLHACAIYCQKLKHGKYDPDKVPEVKEELKDYSCSEVIGTGSFFLFRPLNLSKNITNHSPRFIQHLKSIIQGLPGYQKTLVSLQRYLGLPAK